MLDFGFSEILLTSVIALVVLGPERLPKVARQIGNWVGRARVLSRQLSEQLEREVSAEELLRQRSRPTSPAANATAGTTASADPAASPAPGEGNIVTSAAAAESGLSGAATATPVSGAAPPPDRTAPATESAPSILPPHG